MEMSVQQYAELVGKSRYTIYRWIDEKKNGKKPRKKKDRVIGLPTNVKIKSIAGHDYLVVPDDKKD